MLTEMGKLFRIGNGLFNRNWNGNLPGYAEVIALLELVIMLEKKTTCYLR